jgi:hypothetical protein
MEKVDIPSAWRKNEDDTDHWHSRLPSANPEQLGRLDITNLDRMTSTLVANSIQVIEAAVTDPSLVSRTSLITMVLGLLPTLEAWQHVTRRALLRGYDSSTTMLEVHKMQLRLRHILGDQTPEYINQQPISVPYEKQ